MHGKNGITQECIAHSFLMYDNAFLTSATDMSFIAEVIVRSASVRSSSYMKIVLTASRKKKAEQQRGKNGENNDPRVVETHQILMIYNR